MNADLLINGKVNENCVVKIWERTWIETEDVKGGQTQFSCPNGPNKSYNHYVAKRPVSGEPIPASIDESEKAINAYLDTLAGGPDFT